MEAPIYFQHEVPESYLEKWQHTVNLMARIFDVPAGLIMRVLPEEIEVLIASNTKNNPYEPNEKASLNTGLYCETVMSTRSRLCVENALGDDKWRENPDVKLNMIFYLGVPLVWPDESIFGTICVLDDKTRSFSKLYQDLMWQFKEVIEADFQLIDQAEKLQEYQDHLEDMVEKRTITLKQEIAERKQAEEKLRWESAVNKTLAEVADGLVSPSFSIKEMADLVLRVARDLTGSEHGVVASIDPVTQEVIGHTLTNMMSKECTIKDQSIIFPLGEDGSYPGLWGHALNTLQGFYTNSPTSHKKSIGVPQGHVPLTNYLGVPAVIGNKPVGKIALANKKGPFTQRDLAAIERLATVFALSVQRKQMETALRKSEEKYRGIFNDALDMIHIVDAQGRIIDANPAELGVLGYSREEYIGKSLLDIIHPDIKEETRNSIVQLFAGNNIENYEAILIAKNGDQVDVDVNAVPLIEDGRVIAARAIVRDITARKRAENEILKAKEEWERTFQAIGDIAVILDLNLRVIRVNRKTCEVLSAQAEELEGKLCYELFHGGTEPCEGCPAIKSIKDLKVHTAEVEHEYLGKIFFVSSSAIVDDKGHISGIVHFAKDITVQKKLEKQLVQAQKMEAIGTMSGGIAHDFNNILTPILGYADMALEHISPDNPAALEIQQVLKAANRAKNLVNQILVFARQAEQEIQPLKIQYVIKEALKLLRASIPTTIEIKQQIDPECATVLADPTQIHQIVMNLCTNSYHAMREGGGVLGVSLSQVELGSEELATKLKLMAGPYVRLTISDTGHGINKIDLERIFDPYYTTKDKEEGTGLGLSVVHGIVQSLHGSISVYSEPGMGTTFQVYFPVAEAAAGESEAAETAEPLPMSHEHIMVIDDEEIIANLEKRMLESLGYQVSAFTNCEEALKTYRTHPDSFDLVITDMTMPKINGLQLVKEVFAIKPDVPVIMCTGFSELINEEQAREAGINKFLMKPVLKKDLAIAVGEVLGKRVR